MIAVGGYHQLLSLNIWLFLAKMEIQHFLFYIFAESEVCFRGL